MTEAFEPAIDLAGKLTIAIVESIQDVGHGATLVRQEQILHRHELGNREAVVNLNEAELRARLGDARLFISLLGRIARVPDIAPVPLICRGFEAARDSRLNHLHRAKAPLTERLDNLSRCD